MIPYEPEDELNALIAQRWSVNEVARRGIGREGVRRGQGRFGFLREGE